MVHITASVVTLAFLCASTADLTTLSVDAAAIPRSPSLTSPTHLGIAHNSYIHRDELVRAPDKATPAGGPPNIPPGPRSKSSGIGSSSRAAASRGTVEGATRQNVWEEPSSYARRSPAVLIQDKHGGKPYVLSHSDHGKRGAPEWAERRPVKRGADAIPGKVDIMGEVVNSPDGVRIASLVLASAPSSTGNSSYVLDASQSNHTQILLVVAPPDTTTMTSMSYDENAADLPVMMQIAVFDAATAAMKDYCATFDPSANAPSRMMVEECYDPAQAKASHRSQTFLWNKDTSVVRPLWFDGEDDGTDGPDDSAAPAAIIPSAPAAAVPAAAAAAANSTLANTMFSAQSKSFGGKPQREDDELDRALPVDTRNPGSVPVDPTGGKSQEVAGAHDPTYPADNGDSAPGPSSEEGYPADYDDSDPNWVDPDGENVKSEAVHALQAPGPVRLPNVMAANAPAAPAPAGARSQSTARNVTLLFRPDATEITEHAAGSGSLAAAASEAPGGSASARVGAAEATSSRESSYPAAGATTSARVAAAAQTAVVEGAAPPPVSAPTQAAGKGVNAASATLSAAAAPLMASMSTAGALDIPLVSGPAAPTAAPGAPSAQVAATATSASTTQIPNAAAAAAPAPSMTPVSTAPYLWKFRREDA